jgi:hypothetical protein
MHSALPALPVALAGMLMGTLALCAHDHWISRDRLVDPVNGEWCCNENDCALLPESDVSAIPGGYHVASTGEDIPAARVIWKSADGRWWRCRYLSGAVKAGQTRCLIGPPPGS